MGVRLGIFQTNIKSHTFKLLLKIYTVSHLHCDFFRTILSLRNIIVQYYEKTGSKPQKKSPKTNEKAEEKQKQGSCLGKTKSAKSFLFILFLEAIPENNLSCVNF